MKIKDGLRPMNTTNKYTLLSILSLIFIFSCDADDDLFSLAGDEVDNESFIDPCVIEPGPNCCEAAYNGICEEPLGCLLGTDGDDCRGAIDLVQRCDEETTVIGESNDFSAQSVSFVWTEELEESSFTTDPLLLKISDDVNGLSVSVYDSTYHTGLIWSLNGRPLLGFNDAIAATGALPYDEMSTPEAGCLAVWPFVEGARANTSAELLIVSRRFEVIEPTLNVNVVIVGESDVSEADLDEVFDVAAQIYEQHGGPLIRILDYVIFDGASVIPAEGDEINRLRAQPVGDDLTALTIYFVDDFSEADGTLGIAGGIPGPNGATLTSASGLVIALEPHLTEMSQDFILDTRLMGSTIAHELGHQLGLAHTTEEDSTTSSSITDVISCAREGSDSSDPDLCPDGENLMFWTSGDAPQEELSVSQVEVMIHNPIIQ
jgi:hypothetical protein